MWLKRQNRTEEKRGEQNRTEVVAPLSIRFVAPSTNPIFHASRGKDLWTRLRFVVFASSGSWSDTFVELLRL